MHLTDGAQRPGGAGGVGETDGGIKLIFSAPFHAGGARSAAAGVRPIIGRGRYPQGDTAGSDIHDVHYPGLEEFHSA